MKSHMKPKLLNQVCKVHSANFFLLSNKSFKKRDKVLISKHLMLIKLYRYFKITVVVPAIILEDNNTSEMESNLSLDALESEEKSRRFSQLPPGL